MIVAGVDVGGTNIEVGLVDDDHQVLDRAKSDTPTTGPDSVIAAIVELVRIARPAPTAVGVGIPGVVHDDEVLTVPTLSGWVSQVDLAAELGQRIDVPVELGNECHMWAYSANGSPAQHATSTTFSGSGWAPGSVPV